MTENMANGKRRDRRQKEAARVDMNLGWNVSQDLKKHEPKGGRIGAEKNTLAVNCDFKFTF
jgi:hypothetical protein